MSEPNQPTIPFGQTQPVQGLEIITHARTLHMYSLTEPELNALQESGSTATIDLSLFTLCFGIFITIIITISTVEINDPKIFAAYVASLIVTLIFSIWFGIRSFRGWRNAQSKLKEIKGSS